MTESDLPWVPAAVKAALLADPAFATACPRVGTRLPKDVTSPVVRVQVVGSGDLGGGGYKPLVQVDAYSPPTGPDATEDAEAVVWRIAALAARALRSAVNVPYQSMHWTARITDGPLPDVDTSRGESTPLYRAIVRAELTIHNR